MNIEDMKVLLTDMIEKSESHQDLMYGDTPDEGLFPGFNVTVIAHHGGEDQGSDYWSVYKFEDVESGESVLAKFYGYYQSYNGADYQGFSFVNAREETVIVYK